MKDERLDDERAPEAKQAESAGSRAAEGRQAMRARSGQPLETAEQILQQGRLGMNEIAIGPLAMADAHGGLEVRGIRKGHPSIGEAQDSRQEQGRIEEQPAAHRASIAR